MTQQLTQGYYHVLNGENGLGKTYFLAKLSEQTLENLVNDSIDANSLCPFYIENMICLSGIAFDKFPHYVDFKKKFNEDTERLLKYCYCGYTTNNNISTEIIPFRTVLDIAARKYSDNINGLIEKINIIFDYLERIEFDQKLIIKIGESSTKKIENPDYTLEKSNPDKLKENIKLLIEKINQEPRNDIKDITFYKNNYKYCLTRAKTDYRNLSSGQYQIIRFIFSLVLTITPDSLVIYDEPEISLHPEWQSKIIQILMKIVGTEGLGKDGASNKHATVIIATHSPLITSSFSTSKVKISSDSTKGCFKWDDYQYYGWDANNLLKEHFGLESARSQDFIKKIDNLLSLFQEGKDDELKNEYERIEQLLWNEKTDDFVLSVNDPLHGTLHAIKAYVETIK